MKIKNLKTYLLLTLAVIFGVTACQDDFSEEDFLTQLAQQTETQAENDHERRLEEIRLQAQLAKSSDSALAVLNSMLQEEILRLQQEITLENDSILAARQLEYLRDAGLLLSWTVEVQENRKPLDSVTVTLTTAEASREIVLITTNGTVTAQDIPVGRNVVNLAKTGYFSANVAVEFEMNQFLFVGNEVGYIPMRRHESTILPIFSNTSTETATINGSGVIETDLTNNTPELVPAGTWVKVNMNEALQEADLIYPEWDEDGDPLLFAQRVLTYSVEGGENIGTTTFDASGNFSLIVPALSEGVQVEMLYENISGTVTQAVMFDLVTGEPITPAYQDVSRVFGPDHCFDEAPYQWVPGVMATFDAPPSQGAGFAVDAFTARGRSLGDWTYDGGDNGDPLSNATNPFEPSNTEIMYRVQNFGAGMSSAPTFSVSAPPSGTTASLTANMAGSGFGVSISNGGVGYTTGDNVTFDVYVVIGSDTFYIATFDYSVTADGPLTTGAIDFVGDGITVFDGADVGFTGITNGANGFTNDASGLNEQWYSLQHSTGRTVSFFVEVSGGTATTDATAGVTRSLWIDALTMSGGSGYVAGPTFTASGATTNPVILVMKFATDYTFTLNNTGNSSPYVLLPNVDIFMEDFDGTVGEASNVSYQVLNGPVTSTDINNVLIVDGSGDIQFFDGAFTYYTTTRSVNVPNAVVTDPATETAMGYPFVNEDGQVEGFFDSGFPSSFNLGLVPETGDGYDSQIGVTFAVTIAGAPGSGAVANTLGYTVSSNGEYVWGGNYEMLNMGSNYLRNLNYPFDNSASLMSGWRWFSGIGCEFPSYFDVYPGNTYEIQVHYGSGSEPIESGT